MPETWYPLLNSPTNFEGNANVVLVDAANDRVIQYKNYTSGGARRFWLDTLSTGLFLAQHLLADILVVSSNANVELTAFCLGTDGFLYAITDDGSNSPQGSRRLSKIDTTTWLETAAIAPAHDPAQTSTAIYKLTPFQLSGVNYVMIILQGEAPSFFEVVNVDAMTSVDDIDYGNADICTMVAANQVAGSQILYSTAQVVGSADTGKCIVQKTTFDGAALAVSTVAIYNGPDVNAAWPTAVDNNIQGVKPLYNSADNTLILTFGLTDTVTTTTVPSTVVAKISTSAKSIIWQVPVIWEGTYTEGFSSNASQSDLSSGFLFYSCWQHGTDEAGGGSAFNFPYTVDGSNGVILVIKLADGTYTWITSAHFVAESGFRDAAVISTYPTRFVYYSNFTEPPQPQPWVGGWAYYSPGIAPAARPSVQIYKTM